MRLDRNRPYGEIHGTVERGERYEQDGLLFRGDGTMVEPMEATEPESGSVVDDAEAVPFATYVENVQAPETQRIVTPPPHAPVKLSGKDAKARVLELLAQGMTPREITKETRVQRLLVYKWIKEATGKIE